MPFAKNMYRCGSLTTSPQRVCLYRQQILRPVRPHLPQLLVSPVCCRRRIKLQFHQRPHHLRSTGPPPLMTTTTPRSSRPTSQPVPALVETVDSESDDDASVSIAEIGKNLAAVVNKTFKCVTCGLSFGTNRGLSIHIGRVHPKEANACVVNKLTRDSVLNFGKLPTLSVLLSVAVVVKVLRPPKSSR